MNNPVGFYTLFKRETDRFMKVYLQTLLAPVVSNLLFLAVFSISLQGRIAPFEGVDYLQFLIPGLIMMGMTTNAFANSSSSIVIRRYQNTLTDLLVLPLSTLEIILAFMLSSAYRGILVGVVTLITGMFFVSMPFMHIGIIIASTLMVNGIFSLLGVIIGIWAKDFDRMSLITNFVIMPLSFLGGVFYSIQSLPVLFQKISIFNPLMYMIDSLRYGFLGISDIPIIHSMTFISAVFLILFTITWRMIKTGYRLKT